MAPAGLCYALATLSFASPLRRAPDMPRMQLSPLPLPERAGRLQRLRQRPQYLEQLDPARADSAPLQTEGRLGDDAPDALPALATRRRRPAASTKPDEATVDLWTYQAPGGAIARSNCPCSHVASHCSRSLPRLCTATSWALEERPRRLDAPVPAQLSPTALPLATQARRGARWPIARS